MERFIHAGRLPAHLRGGIAALGNFDGFHLGHQAVVGLARDRARAEGRPTIVVTFDPHPARLFRPDLPVICLSGAKAGISAAGGCLAKPLQSSELHAALDASLRGDSVGWDPRFAEALNGPAAARARARFAVAGDLVEAAMELARVDRGA